MNCLLLGSTGYTTNRGWEKRRKIERDVTEENVKIRARWNCIQRHTRTLVRATHSLYNTPWVTSLLSETAIRQYNSPRQASRQFRLHTRNAQTEEKPGILPEGEEEKPLFLVLVARTIPPGFTMLYSTLVVACQPLPRPPHLIYIYIYISTLLLGCCALVVVHESPRTPGRQALLGPARNHSSLPH